MKSIRTDGRWVLPICAALFASSATADIPSAANACVLDFVETTPSSDFTALEDGAVVRHEPTGLEWRRCPEGMSWTGTGCTGSANTWTWQGALQHADTVSGWRLPNINELRSIVEECRSFPAVNQEVFPGTINEPEVLPGTPSSYYWSASPNAELSPFAWIVDFGHGGDSLNSKSSSNTRVRLVRAGQ